MQETLNFGRAEKKALKKILSSFEQGRVTNYFEEARARHRDCTITLYESGKISIQGENAAIVKDEILEKLGLAEKLVTGIDETGRGERTGPMVIAGVLADTNQLRQLRDSKKTGDIRGKERIVSEKMLGSVIVTLNSKLIDLARNRGLNLNTIEAGVIEKIAGVLGEFGDPVAIVDGAPLPVKDRKIKFKPKADDSEPVVGAASIVAKNARNNSADMGERLTWRKKS